MSKPFHTFMENIIDYAGLFPPALLPMDEAIRQYAGYRKSPENWMLSRFICPAARLRELKMYKDTLFSDGEPFNFSVLGRSGKNKTEFLSGLGKDLELIREFIEFNENRVVIDVFETRLPEDITRGDNVYAISQFLNTVAAALEENAPIELTVYYETNFINFGKFWEKALRSTVNGIAEHNRYIQRTGKLIRYKNVGFKMRCGGVEPQSYPTPEQVAVAIDACANLRLPLKATAGLHHPIRHFNQDEKIIMHGFLNVFGAVILAEAHHLEASQIQEIIEDEDTSNFMFTRRAFAWKNLRASVDEIKTAREKYAVSFGSCSFDEPREDLRALKLM
jgi:hypothetical protein